MQASRTPTNIEEQQQYLLGLYGEENKKRGEDYLYGYLSRSTAYLGKNLASGKADDLHFFRSISWLFAIANLFGIDVQESLRSRFPGLCPYCQKSPCVCFKTKKLPPEPRPAHKMKVELTQQQEVFKNITPNYSLNDAIVVLSKIYPANEIIWHHAGPWHLIAKMQEEVGELHEAVSKVFSEQKPVSAISEEIADTLAWVLSAWKVTMHGRSIDDAFVDYYMNDCPVCTSFPCACAKRADRAAELVDARLLEEIRQQLQSLQEALPDAKGKLQELQESIAAATTDQNEPTTVHALKQTKGTLEKLRSGLATADDIGQRGLSIINTIMKTLEKLNWLT